MTITGQTYEMQVRTQDRRERVGLQCQIADAALTALERHVTAVPGALRLVPVAQRGVLATMLADELLRLHTAAQQALLAVATAAAEVARDE